MKAFWNIIFGIIFIAFVFGGLDWLALYGRLTLSVPLVDIFLMALAVARLVRLFTYDHITAFVRHWFKDAREGSFRGTLGELINCPWCSGLWFGGTVVFFYLATPWAWPVILILAVASLGSLFQIFANYIGWCAEHKKKTVLDG